MDSIREIRAIRVQKKVLVVFVNLLRVIQLIRERDSCSSTTDTANTRLY